MRENVVHTAEGQGGRFEVYQTEGSSRFNLRKVNKNGKGKFMRGYRTVEEARTVANSYANAAPVRRMV
jgi:bacillopeptidase F (M6 metalloprotease family)